MFRLQSIKKVLMGLGLLAMFSVHAQENVEQNQPQFIENQWFVGCTMIGEAQQFNCELSKSIVQADTAQMLMTFLVRNMVSVPGTNEMIIRLPHGINIQSGVSLRVDDQEEANVPILRTDSQGVLAALQLSDELNDRLKNGNNAIVKFVMANGQTLNVQFSLVGYTKTFNKFSS